MERYKIYEIFGIGAAWMQERLNEIRGETKVFDKTINYRFYGILKYFLSAIAFFITFYYTQNHIVLLTPLSIIAFYLVEVHFLVLFPLLIDGVKNPILKSIQLIYKIGLVRAILNVIPIGCFMFFGLFNYKKPFDNWYIGCLAIIYWYEYEIRNWI